MQLKITEVSARQINTRGRARDEKDQLSRIIRRALRLKNGRALKIYANGKARVVAQRLNSRARHKKLPIRAVYKKHTVWVYEHRSKQGENNAG